MVEKEVVIEWVIWIKSFYIYVLTQPLKAGDQKEEEQIGEKSKRVAHKNRWTRIRIKDSVKLNTGHFPIEVAYFDESEETKITDIHDLNPLLEEGSSNIVDFSDVYSGPAKKLKAKKSGKENDGKGKKLRGGRDSDTDFEEEDSDEFTDVSSGSSPRPAKILKAKKSGKKNDGKGKKSKGARDNDTDFEEEDSDEFTDVSLESSPRPAKILKANKSGKKNNGKGKKSRGAHDNDTDFEEEDSDEFTCSRRKNKSDRYERRKFLKNAICPSTEEGNKEIIEKFESWLRYKYNITNWDRKTSTYYLSISHLFKYEDSLLQFELKRDPLFKLEQQVLFDHSHFRELSDPKEWFLSTAGASGKEGGNDRVEKIKAWKRYCYFVKDQLNDSRTNSGTSIEQLLRYQMLLTNIDNLFNRITSNNMMKSAKIAANIEKRARENAEEYLSPSKRFCEKDAVKNWFNSDKYRQLLEEMLQLWRTAVESKEMNKKDFVRFAHFVKFTLILTSKNRNSVYKFTNNDYIMKTGLWIPESNQSDSDRYITERPQNVPDEEANCWIIKLCGAGAGIKNQEAQTIFISKACQELLTKYQDLKTIFLPDVSAGDQFFVNMDSKPLPEISNTKGSLWDRFVQVANLDKASVNTIRRGLEHEVQSSSEALAKIKDIQSHSQETGSGAYHKTSPYIRAEFMNKVAHKEGANNFVEDVDIPDDIHELRKKRSEKDKLICQASVIKTRSVKRKRISKATSILPKDRDFLESIFLDKRNYEIYNTLKEKFPVKSVFKKLFYRLIDGHSGEMDEELKNKLKEVEERIFLSIKDSVEKECDQPWGKCSKNINQLADMKICGIIRNSLYWHERNKLNDSDKVFKFKK